MVQLAEIADLARQQKAVAIAEKLQEGVDLDADEFAFLEKAAALQERGGKSEYEAFREQQADRRRRSSAAGRDIEIRFDTIDWDRRNVCEHEPELFLRTYLSEYFFREFTESQREIVRAIACRMRGEGSWQAIAAPRGDGKTTICKGLIVWGDLYGHIKFPVVIAANKDFAEAILEDVKEWVETSELLAEDFPEVCAPVHALGRMTQRGKGQTHNGEHTRIEWGTKRLRFPTITMPDGRLGASSGSVLLCLSIEGPIKGRVKGKLRPDFCLIEDIEDEDSVDSVTETNMRERKLEKEVIGLGGAGQRIAIVMLCTIAVKDCIADRYTDMQRKPAWQGIRQAFVISWPDREDLWNEYMAKRQQDAMDGDPDGRTAHAFFQTHYDAMLKGFESNNPYRLDTDTAADGTQKETSPAEHVYNLLADGQETYVWNELQNQPRNENAEDELRLTAPRVMQKTSGLARGLVPSWCEALTSLTDVRGRQLHWGVWACRTGGTAWCVDYGVETVHSPEGRLMSDENRPLTEAAIYQALLVLRDQFDHGWPVQGSEEDRWDLDVALVDARWLTSTICAFVRTDSTGVWQAAMGCGDGQGQPRFKMPRKRPRGTRGIKRKWQGDGWFAAWQPEHKCNIIFYDQIWKRRVQNGFLVDRDVPGSLCVWGDLPIRHKEFAEHICAERWERQWQQKGGWVSKWVPVSKNNHWLDSTAGALAAASIAGVRMSMSELAETAGAA